jgi:hypothetical protein
LIAWYFAYLDETSMEICHNPNIFGGYSQITFPRKTPRENFLSKYCGKRKGGGEGVNPFKAKIKYIKRGSSFFTRLLGCGEFWKGKMKINSWRRFFHGFGA